MAWITLLVTSAFCWFFIVYTKGPYFQFSGSDVSVRWVLALPALGILMVAMATREGLRNLRFLSHGLPAKGRLVAKDATRVRINDQTVFALTFAYRDHSGRERRVVARTHEPWAAEDEAEEVLLYDPDAPERAVVVDALPGGIVLDAAGGLEAGSSVSVLIALVIPVFTVGLNAAAAWYLI